MHSGVDRARNAAARRPALRAAWRGRGAAGAAAPAWALGSAILLRRAAEQLRETALNDLRTFRLLGRDVEAKRQMFDQLIAEIRDLKTGAFAPLTDQPFIRAVLFPGAAVGLLAVGQRLFDIF